MPILLFLCFLESATKNTLIMVNIPSLFPIHCLKQDSTEKLSLFHILNTKTPLFSSPSRFFLLRQVFHFWIGGPFSKHPPRQILPMI